MKKNLLLFLFLSFNSFFASAQCDYPNQDFEEWFTAPLEIGGITNEITTPENHISSIRFFFYFLEIIFGNQAALDYWENDPQGFWGIDQSTDASSGDFAVKLKGDDNINVADLWSVMPCNQIEANLFVDVKHVGSGVDTLILYGSFDENVGPIPESQAALDTLAAYFIGQLIIDSTTDYSTYYLPVIINDPMAPVDTFSFLAFSTTSPDTYWLIDNVQLNSLTDNDSDGFLSDVDCDDDNPNVNPAATETCNGIDDNCDGDIDEGVLSMFYYDADGDGFGTPDSAMMDCSMPMGFASNNMDCDDNNENVNPIASEDCNGIDDNCDGDIDEGLVGTFFLDSDGDGYGDFNSPTMDCFMPTGYVTNSEDCDDTDPLEQPNQTWYPDADGDGYSDGNSVTSCERPMGLFHSSEILNLDGDCNDFDANTFPGAAEICDYSDNDCNGLIDDDVISQDYYFDGDGDGYGTGVAINDCQSPGANYVPQGGDCDDTNANVNPGVTEICDGLDNNCDGEVDEDVVLLSYYLDGDGDGYGTGTAINDCESPGANYVTQGGDCDDTNADVNPGMSELCDGLDNDCNGMINDGLVFQDYYLDTDGDGYGVGMAINDCQAPAGNTYATQAGDCDDTNADVNPGQTELCNGEDDNCNGQTDEGLLATYFLDSDSDGFGDDNMTITDCGPSGDYVANGGDCDDSNNTVFPGADELCDGIDNNCDGEVDEGLSPMDYYLDSDGDGFGSGMAISDCTSPGADYVTQTGDCDDSNADINPGATEICDGVDNNCDGDIDEGVLSTFYLDSDGDGFGSAFLTETGCDAPMGYVDNPDDCDDDNAAINPPASEICNGMDDNCDGSVDEGVLITYYADADGDGFGDANVTQEDCSLPNGFAENSDDCDDTNADINPDATEIPANNIDEDCDGMDGMVNTDELVELNIRVFPNPVSTTIILENVPPVGFEVELFNLVGQQVAANWSMNISQIDVAHLSDGIYFVKITETETARKKVVMLVKE